MPALPYIYAPKAQQARRVGNEASGILEIPVRGGLTVAESDTIAELLAAEPSAFVKAAQLADAIAQTEEITQAEAFEVVEQAAAGAQLEAAAEALRLKYADRIEAVSRLYLSERRRSLVASVTAILKHRLNQPDWGVEDTQQLPRVLLNDVWQLIMDEQDAESLPSSRPSDEELKKQPPATGSGRKRTGAASSGA